MIRKICVVTGSRADYDHLYWLLKLLKKNKKFDLSIIVTGSHLEKKYGASIKNITKDGFKKLHKIKLFLSKMLLIGMLCFGVVLIKFNS